MDKSLQIRVAFQALDKLSGPLRALSAGSEKLSAGLSKARGEVAKLEKQQRDIAAFRDMKTEMQATAREMNDAKSRATQLGRELAQTEKPTAKLRKEFQLARRNSELLERKFQDQSQKLNAMRRELATAGIDTAKLASHQRDLAAKVDAANKSLSEQKKRIIDVKKAAERAQRVKELGSKVAGVGAMATVGATLPIAGVFNAAWARASDNVEMESAFDVTFGKASAAVRKWADVTGSQMHRTRSEMMQMAMSYQDLLSKSLGPDQAATMSKRLTILTQDLASFKNLSNDEARSKIFSGLIGEAEPLRAVGVLLSDNAVKAKALAMGMKAQKGGLTEGQKVQARAALILEQLANANGDVIRTQDSTANRMKSVSTSWENFLLKVGDILLKLTPVLDKVSALLDSFQALPPGLQQLIVWGAAIVALGGPILTMVGGIISIFGSLAGVAATLGVGFAPFLAVIAVVIGAVVGAAILIYRNWDTIKAKLDPLIDAISSTFMKFVDLFSSTVLGGPLGWFVGVIADALGGSVLAIINTLVDVVTAGFTIIGGVIDLVSALLSGDFSKAWEAAKTIFGAGVNGIAAILRGMIGIVASIGNAIIDGLIRAFEAGWSKLKSIATSLADMLPQWMKKPLGIHSPSRVFMAIGGNITEGLTRGIDRGTGPALHAAKTMAVGITGAGIIGASAITTPASPAGATGPARAFPSGPITINVYGAAGQSAEEIARAVRAEFERREGQRQAAARSAFRDD